MPKKNQGGKKKHRGKNQQNDKNQKLSILKEEGTEYGKILERKGGPHMSVRLLSGNTVMGVVRGKMRRRVWMSRNDIVLVSIRDFQGDKVDIVHKYPEDHVRQLVDMGEIPDYFTVSDSVEDSITGDNIFGEKTEYDDIEEWEKKYEKVKQSWELYLAQGNIKKATDMKLKLEKLMEQKPKPKIPEKMTQDEFDAL